MSCISVSFTARPKGASLFFFCMSSESHVEQVVDFSATSSSSLVTSNDGYQWRQAFFCFKSTKQARSLCHQCSMGFSEIGTQQALLVHGVAAFWYGNYLKMALHSLWFDCFHAFNYIFSTTLACYQIMKTRHLWMDVCFKLERRYGPAPPCCWLLLVLNKKGGAPVASFWSHVWGCRRIAAGQREGFDEILRNIKVGVYLFPVSQASKPNDYFQ